MSFKSLLLDWAISLYLPNFLQSMTDGVRVPLIPAFAKQMGATTSTIGIVVGMAGLSKALFDIPFGIASSYLGCAKVMMWGMVINIIGAVIIAVSTKPYQLGIGSFFCGAGIGAFFVARHVFIAAAVPREIRGRSMSIIGGTARWAVVFGPALSGMLISLAGMQAAALSLIPLSVACALCTERSQKVRDVDAKRHEMAQSSGSATHELEAMYTAWKRYWDIVIRLGVYCFNILSLRQARRLLLVLAGMNMDLQISVVGLILSASFAVDALLFFLGGYIMDRFGRKYAAIPTTVNLGIAFFFLEVSTTPLTLVLSALFFGLADSTGAGILMTLTADHSPPSGGAPFMGLMRTVQDAGQVTGSVLCGILIHHLSFSWACVIFGITGILNGVWAFFMIPTKSASQLEEEEAQDAAAAAAAGKVTLVETLSTEETEELQMEDRRIVQDGEKLDFALRRDV